MKKSGTVLVALVFAAALLAVFAGCARKNQQPVRKNPRIGFSMDSLVVERWQRDRDVFTAAMSEMGAEVILQNADQDPDVQARQIEALVRDGIDVLVVIPNDANKLTPVIQDTKRRGIPVLSYDRLVRNANVDLYISFDNVEVGRLMASYIHTAVPNGSYVVINGAKSDYNAHMISDGIHESLKPSISDGSVKIVDEVWLDAWRSEDALAAMERILSQDTRVDAVIAGNDMLADAVFQAVSERRLAGKVKIAGQDADLSACQRLLEGTQLVTVYKPIDRLAQKAAAMAILLARHQPVAADGTIDDGSNQVPYLKLTPIAVTRENLDETVIRDGFHRREDVYRNR
jgi:D-xylose transport system substrate-binding protein